ncbi:MAG: hypothetical protein RSD49_01665 [Hafnia sp.]
MAWSKEPPQQTGWYWVKHKHYGKVITQVKIAEGEVHVSGSEFSGWNRLCGVRKTLYLEWDHTPISEPQD